MEIKGLEAGLECSIFDVEKGLHVRPSGRSLSWALPGITVIHLIVDVESVENSLDGCLLRK
jgi:hypothetical protein